MQGVEARENYRGVEPSNEVAGVKEGVERFPTSVASRVALPFDKELEAAAAEKAFCQDGLHLPLLLALDDDGRGRSREAVIGKRAGLDGEKGRVFRCR